MAKKEKKEKKLWQKILQVILIVILAVVVLFAGLVLVLTITEYKPADQETLEVKDALGGETTASLSAEDGALYTLLTWNVGYLGLGEEADFFMDGGEKVSATNKDGVYANGEGVAQFVTKLNPDFVFFQELDRNSKRSHSVDEYELLREKLPAYNSSYAINYKTLYVPYPIPPIGKVECGVSTFSQYQVKDATRLQLPCPFSWPVRLANLKRCLDVSRIAIEGTDKELVLVNLHLEAYDAGEGKIAQTKMLVDVLQQEYDAGNYVIAAGDFNQCFSNVDTSAYPVLGDNWEASLIDVSDFGGDFNLLMDNSVPSCRLLDQPYKGADPETVQYYMIDGFIFSQNVDVQNITTYDEQFKYSDHNPVSLEFALGE